MDEKKLRELLKAVKTGKATIDDAVDRLTPIVDGDLGYAHVDLERSKRCGYPEVIFCEGKTNEWVVGVVRKLIDAEQDCLATRVSEAQSKELSKRFPKAEQDRLARTFLLQSNPAIAPIGKVVVVTAGTSDLPVAQEALVTAQAIGTNVSMMADVGVAGIHRLLNQRGQLAHSDAIIVAAGMDGALPSVVGGLVDCPVIAVPTSVGYGAAFGGVAALLTMLNACPANVAVVNIDAGFKAGYIAAMIARQSIRIHQNIEEEDGSVPF